MDTGAWQATIHDVHKESDMTERLSHTSIKKKIILQNFWYKESYANQYLFLSPEKYTEPKRKWKRKPTNSVSVILGDKYNLQPSKYAKRCPQSTVASLVVERLKRLSTMRETWVQSLGWEDPLEKEMATHSSILAWRIPWTEEPGGLQSMGSLRVGHDWLTSLTHTHSLKAPKSRTWRQEI